MNALCSFGICPLLSIWDLKGLWSWMLGLMNLIRSLLEPLSAREFAWVPEKVWFLTASGESYDLSWREK